MPTQGGEVLKEEENITDIGRDNTGTSQSYVAARTGVAMADAATLKKHIDHICGTNNEMVELMIEGLRGKVIFPDKTPTVPTINQNGEEVHRYIQGRELIRFNCRWIYYVSQELFALENEESEDIKLTNQEAYQQAMRDITEILSFSQSNEEYQAMIDAILEHNLEHLHKEVNGVETMEFPTEAPPARELREIEEEEEEPSIRSHYYAPVTPNDWDIKTKRTGNLRKDWNAETYQQETFVEYETLPEHKYNLMENRE